MDGSRISCECSKGYYGGSVEVNLCVHQLNIELTEEACYAQEGEAKLTFTRCKKTSPTDENIKSKIASRIVKMTHGTVQIQNSSQYSMLMPLESVLKSSIIVNLKSNFIINGKTIRIEDCKTTSIIQTTENDYDSTTNTDGDKNRAELFQAMSVIIILMLVIICMTYGH